MTTAPVPLSDHVLTVQNEIRVQASLETTFQALLDQLGPEFSTPDGVSLSAKVEAWPGGRWYRDLGHGNGHLWAHVQAVKRPTLLEFTGPLMLSYAVANNVQYRLREEGAVTVIEFHHYGFGAIPESSRSGMRDGWAMLLDRIKARAEKNGAKS